MIAYPEYLRLLPKAELHCHIVSTMRASTLVELATLHEVPLKSYDLAELLDYDNLPDFLDVFNAAHDVLRTPEELARMAYEGVEDGIAEGNLRYREYFINPDNFRDRFDYPTLIDALIEGLSAAERDFGVGFGLVIAVNRSLPAADAVALVATISAHPRDAVLGLGMDDLTPEKTEDPLRFVEAYAAARAAGLKLTAHVGETMTAAPTNVTDAIDVLGVDRIDHGYRVVDDPAALARAQEAGIPFTCTPHSTGVLSGWEFTPEHRIRTMLDAGLRVSLATDDAVFFRTDIGAEYHAALPAMGVGPEVAKQISLEGFASSWAPDAVKERYLADARALHRALDAVLDPATVPGA